jgi:apolipoprotein N-acyltransferase
MQPERSGHAPPTRSYRPSNLLRLGLTALSATLLALCFEPFAVAPLAWVALVPLLVALWGASPSLTRGLAFLFGMAFYGLTVHWLFVIFGTAAIALIGILAATTWAFGLCVSLLQRRFGPQWAALLAPVAWLGVDLFRCELWYFRFPWAQIGFSQVEAPLVLQLASVVGVYGLTFLIVLCNAGLACVLVRHGLRWGLLAAASAIAAGALIGRVQLRDWPDAAPSFCVAAIQTEASDLEMNLALTAEAASRGAQLVVWPEYSLMDYPLDDPRLLPRLSQAAREARAYLAVGCKERVPGGPEGAFHNATLVLDPGGNVIGSYHKRYPVQFFNDGVKGQSFPAFPTLFGRMGIAICYDLDFAPVSRKLVSNGAEFLVIPSYDAIWWGRNQHLQHSAMAPGRAVEHRRWVLRATSSGISQIIDPSGNVVESLGIGEEGVLVGEMAPGAGLTPYDRGGYLISHICLALTVAFLIVEAAGDLARWRRGRAPEQPARPHRAQGDQATE